MSSQLSPTTPILKLIQGLNLQPDDHDKGSFPLPEALASSGCSPITWQWNRPREFGSLNSHGITDAMLTISSGCTQAFIKDARLNALSITICSSNPFGMTYMGSPFILIPEMVYLHWGKSSTSEPSNIPACDIRDVVAHGLREAGYTLKNAQTTAA